LIFELAKTHEGFATLEDNVVAGIRGTVLKRWPALEQPQTARSAIG